MKEPPAIMKSTATGRQIISLSGALSPAQDLSHFSSGLLIALLGRSVFAREALPGFHGGGFP